ncbi:MAG: hypothetical protein H8E37_03430 [Planctomycetes bacterium]|nr:hypothetical protein [Planctomycetota bacterium]
MHKHIVVLLLFAVLAAGCAKLPFSTVDSSEPTPVTDDREVRMTSFEQTEPVALDPPQETRPGSPLPGFLIPENTRTTWNGRNFCTRTLDSTFPDACVPQQYCAPPVGTILPTGPVDNCPPNPDPLVVCAAPPLPALPRFEVSENE